MENQASCCISPSVSEVEACKLPLLDGESSGPLEIITTVIQLQNAGNNLDSRRRDRTQFSSTACTAWAILLRCYTGQDQVTFEYTTDNADATVSLLQMNFDENEILSKYTESARYTITGIEEKRVAAKKQSVAPLNYETVSSSVNTTVCICGSEALPGMLGAKHAGRPMEVSGYYTANQYLHVANDLTRAMSHCWWKTLMELLDCR